MRKCGTFFLGFCLIWTLFGFKLDSEAIKDTTVDQSLMPQWRDTLRKGVISNVEWSEDGKLLKYVTAGNHWQCNLQTYALKEIGESKEEQPTRDRWRGYARTIKMGNRDVPVPSRGHQFLTEISPDEKWFSVCKDWNVFLENAATDEIIQVTTKGHRKLRYGTANWTYGEELDQRHGMWWSPDSRKLVYYVFDERPVQDFYLSSDLTEINTKLLTEGYIKAGATNPIVWLEIFNLESKKRTPVDVRQKDKDQYIYNMRFTPEGKELLFNRIDRHHHRLDVIALDVETSKTRIVVSETQETWQENSPTMEFLEDGKRFVWETEKTMYRQYELHHLDGSLITTLTKGEYPATRIYKVDNKNGYLYYGAYSDKHPLCEQLHRIELNGRNQKRLTPLSMNYLRFEISPDGKYFTAQFEDINTPSSTGLFSTEGKLVKVLGQDENPEKQLSELFSFTANDRKTILYGVLHKPKDFDPNMKYPLRLSVYGGPDSRAVTNRYQNGNRDCERGYLVAQIDNRGTSGRGKAFKAALYKKLGDVDIEDQADGIRYLMKQPYVDNERIGIVGHSYGGFMAAMGIVKYPDIFTAAVDRAGVTDWRNYDSIYTERYMSLPQDNEEGYDTGSVMKFVKNLKEGNKLLIMHGMVDDNVHPNNAWQLIDALDKADFKYESRFFPTAGHGFGGSDTQWEFFDRWLKKY